MYNPLLRRTLVPLLIIALPISATIAWILYNKKAGQTITPPKTTVQPASFGNESWPVFRGNPELTGLAKGQLPDKLKLAWKFETESRVISTPIIFNDTVYVSSMDNHLYALELKTGDKHWRFDAGEDLEASPLFFDNTVYIGSTSGTLFAISAESGQQQWVYKDAEKIAGAPNIARHPTTGKPLVVFGSYDNNLYCLNATDGALLFKYPAENYINGAVAVSQAKAFFGSCDAMIYQVPLDDANATVTLTTESYVAGNPAVEDNLLFAGNLDGHFIAADIETQKILWTFEDGEDAFYSSPAVNDKVIIVGCRDQKLYCFEKGSGSVRWTFEGGGSFDSSPVICGDKTVVGNDDGRLYMIDIQSGKEIFSYTLGSPIASSPAIAQNYCLIGCNNGIVYAFTADNDSSKKPDQKQ